MGPRASVVAGLAAGALVTTAVLVGIVVLVPDPRTAIVVPSVPTISEAPSASVDVVVSASPSLAASPTGVISGFHVGESAPPLHVAQVGGGTIDIAALKGKPLWIYFMATSCPSCQDEIPIMTSVAVRYASTGLVIVAVDVREDEGTVAAFADRLGAKFPFGLDADGSAQRVWGAIALPVHFWIDKEGIVRYGALGGIGPDIMAKGLAQILPGVTITF